MSDNNKNMNVASLFLAALTVLFVAFKLAGIGDVANWSWFWVLAPIWSVVALVFVILAVVGLIWVVASITLYIKAKRRGVRLVGRRYKR